MNSVRLNNLSLKNQRFTPSGWKTIGIRKFEFVAKTQFLSIQILGTYGVQSSHFEKKHFYPNGPNHVFINKKIFVILLQKL